MRWFGVDGEAGNGRPGDDASTDRPGRSRNPERSAREGVGIDDVTLAFDGTPVLDGVSFSANSGELVGLVGPNGAGKTTCLRAISGALEPTGGSIRLGGVDIENCSSRASSRLVAVVPQETTLAFSFPVRDVVAMGRHPYRSRFRPPDDRDRAAVDRALARTQTDSLADRPIDEVSGGERRRVLIARALAQETPVLLLDEPTANLDVNHQVEVLELVRTLVDDGTTAIAAIHDLGLAARYCDRLVLLANGTVQRAGEPEAVLADPALAESFDATLATVENPVTGTSTVTPLPTDDHGLPDRVHVIGSGSVGAGVLARLAAAGVKTSVGPVPDGDQTADLATVQATAHVTVPPFEPLSGTAVDETRALLAAADVVVLADPHPETVAPIQETLASLEGVVVVTETDDHVPLTQRDTRQPGPDRDLNSVLAERAIRVERAAVLDGVARAARRLGDGDPSTDGPVPEATQPVDGKCGPDDTGR